MICAPHRSQRMREKPLEHRGIYVKPINDPPVPRGGERLSITPTPLHTEEHMRPLMEALVEVRTRQAWGEVSRAT